MITKIIISTSSQYTHNKWGKMKVVWHRIANMRRGKRVSKHTGIIAHQSDDYRVGGKNKAADWLPHVHIPDGNQNLDQNSLVKLPTPCIHVEKPEAQMEFCV